MRCLHVAVIVRSALRLKADDEFKTVVEAKSMTNLILKYVERSCVNTWSLSTSWMPCSYANWRDARLRGRSAELDICSYRD